MLEIKFIGKLHPLFVLMTMGVMLFSFTSHALAQLNAPKAFPYRDIVQPILENKCYSCHSATKMKGGLRLDSEAFIIEGGKHGSVLTAANPDKSVLFTNLILPDDDDDHMPPKEKPQLTDAEKEAIRFWIKNGAPFGEPIEPWRNLQSFPKVAAQNVSKVQITEGGKKELIINIEKKILEQKTEAVDKSILDKLKKLNIVISSFGEKSNYLMANFVNVKNYNSALIDDLQSINNQLIRLNLSNQSVSDDDVKKLVHFKNLTQLKLDKTAVTDAGLVYLKNLPNLEILNLYGTKVTDNGLVALAQCPNLKIVYLWQTQSTTVGIEKLKKALPNLQVEMGGFSFPKPDTSKSK